MRRVLLVHYSGAKTVARYSASVGAFDVLDEFGERHTFVPLAQVDALPARTFPLIGDDAGQGEVRVVLANAADVGAMFAARISAPLQASTWRVFWWPEDEILTDSHEVFVGSPRDVSWDVDGGEVSFVLRAARREQDAPFPPCRLTKARFPDAPSDSLAFALPVVYGAPKGLPAVAVTDVTVDPIRLVVASHEVASTTLELVGSSGVIDAAAPVLYDRDALGDLYAYVEIAAADFGTEGSSLYFTSVSGYAFPDGRSITLLGDVLAHLFKTYAQTGWTTFDRRRIEFARPRLNAFAVSFFANEQSPGETVESFATSRIAGQFPVSFGAPNGRFGWDAITFPNEVDARPAASIVMGVNAFERTNFDEESVDNIVSRIEVAYALDGNVGGQTEIVRFDETTSGLCARAFSRWGPSAVLSLDAPDCNDAATAYLLGADALLKNGVLRARVEYAGVDESFFDLPPGAIIAVTDEDLDFEGELFVLEGVEPLLDGTCAASLITLDGA